MIKCVLMAALLLAACSKSDKPAGGGGATPGAGGSTPEPGHTPEPGPTPGGGSGPIAYPDSADGLKQLVLDATAATPERAKVIDDSLVLPNAEPWFVATFGPEAGTFAYGDYAPMAARIGSLSQVFAKNKADGKTEIKVTRVDDSTTPGATREQTAAMMVMKTKVPLYRVEMLAPGEDLGFSLASFAFVDGAFRFIGKPRVP